MRRQGRNIRPPPGRGFALLAACSVVASSPAKAQDAAPAETTREDKDPASTAANDGLNDIVVTARRRSETLQRVPVSVIALSEKELESRSVTNTRTLQNFVPNLTFAPSQNVGEAAGNIFIRGIGQEDFGVGAEPGVGFYVDGVYFARPLGTILNLTDIARIEVLRGPQGTLFGKNTIGGAINVISVMPRPRRERRFSAILGNYDRVELRAIVNEPLSENVFMRLSIGTVSRDGYLRRLAPPAPHGPLEQVNNAQLNNEREGDDHSQAGRLQLRWLIGDTLTADLSMDGSRKRNNQGATHIDAIDPGFGVFRQLNRLIREGKLPGPEITNDLSPDSLLESYAAGKNFLHQDFWGASAVITKDLGANTLKFIGAYRGLRSRVGTDIDGLYFDLFESEIRANQRQLTGEMQLAGAKGALSYTAGLFVIDENAKLLPDASIMNKTLYTCGCFYPPGNAPVFTTVPRHLRTNSYAGYAQGTYRITDRLSATLGARYSHERKSIDGKAFRLDANLQPTNMVVVTGTNRGAWNSLTYRAGLEYQATPDLMAYGSIARGFKSGGFNVRTSLNLPNLGFTSFKPETALTYEVGLRSQWLDRRLRFNATLFHSAYASIQLRQQTIVAGLVTTLIENAAKARIRGAEVELTAVPIEGLTLSAAYGQLSPRYLDVGRVPGLTLASRFQRTPSHSISASVHYEVPLRSGTLELHGDYSYRSKEQFQITAALNDQEGYGLLGARLTFRTKDDCWSMAIFGTNLADQRYRTAGRGTLINQTGIAYSSIGLPRQVGLQVTTTF
ncbi:MAG: TonB-dependent receptor [Sphingomicrobium sp.]